MYGGNVSPDGKTTGGTEQKVLGAKIAMEEDFMDDEVLYELTHKLNLRTSEDNTGHPIPYPATMSVSVSDEDISMKDYTEEEIDGLAAVGAAAQHHTSSTLRERRRKSTEEGTAAVRDENEDVDEEPGSETANGNSISLIRTILAPETQGYMLGAARSGNQRRDASEDEPGEGVVADSSPQTHTTIGKLNDKNVIIHNHFYNIIAGPGPGYGLDDPQALWAHENLEDSDRRLRLFEYVKKTLNYSLLLGFAYLAVRQVTRDIGVEYQRLMIRENLQKEQCVEEYYVNRCDEYGQLPALKDECLEWRICMSEGNTNHIRTVFYSELAMQVVGRLINETLDSIGGMNRLFLLVALSVWYLVNFACGYMRGNHDHDHPHNHDHRDDIRSASFGDSRALQLLRHPPNPIDDHYEHA